MPHSRPELPENEARRLSVLKSYNVLDTLPEDVFDDITQIASTICNVPIALVSLIDENRQWFKSRHGLDATETPREYAFCAHAINQPDQIMEVTNSDQDDRFKDNPLVTGQPHVKFYAGAPLVTPDGFALGTLCVIDNKENKLSDQQRASLKALSRQVVTQLELKRKNEEIHRVAKRAEDASEAKSEFLSMMSHEIRTPLNAIIGMTHILLQENPREDQLENLKVLEFSGNNLLALVNDILDYNKIEAGKVLLEKTDFNLKELLISIKSAQELRANEKGIALKLLIDDDLPDFVQGDSGRLSQVLNNLISNAIKFTTKGSVRIVVELQAVRQASLQIAFKVIDTGIGISDENIEKIFQQFTQAESDTTRKYGGTGLGLAISRKLLQLMQSQIHVESTLGQGSTFSFSMELTKSHKVARIVDQDLASDGSSAKLNIRCLVAEDNKANQIVVGKFLSSWGVDYDLAENGIEALKKVQENKYDIILMDIQMPGMNGYDATEKIRAMSEDYFKSVPILALTASAMIDVRGKALAIGMTDFVSKPIVPSELRNKIVKFVKRNHEECSENGGKQNEQLRVIEGSPSMDSLVQMMDELSPDDRDFRNELVTLHVEVLLELQQKLNDAIASQDASLAEIAIHKAKTTLSAIGFKTLDEATEAVLGYIADGSGDAEDLKEELDQAVRKTVIELRKLIQYSQSTKG